MTDRVLLENQIAIMSALVEIAHAVEHGGQVSTATIASLRERAQESERQRDAPGMLLNMPDDWSMERIRDFGDRLRKASTPSRISEQPLNCPPTHLDASASRYASVGELRERLCTRVSTMTDQELVDLSSNVPYRRTSPAPIWQTGYMSAERHLSADEQAIKDEAIRRDLLKRAKSKY